MVNICGTKDGQVGEGGLGGGGMRRRKRKTDKEEGVSSTKHRFLRLCTCIYFILVTVEQLLDTYCQIEYSTVITYFYKHMCVCIDNACGVHF